MGRYLVVLAKVFFGSKLFVQELKNNCRDFLSVIRSVFSISSTLIHGWRGRILENFLKSVMRTVVKDLFAPRFMLLAKRLDYGESHV